MPHNSCSFLIRVEPRVLRMQRAELRLRPALNVSRYPRLRSRMALSVSWKQAGAVIVGALACYGLGTLLAQLIGVVG